MEVLSLCTLLFLFSLTNGYTVNDCPSQLVRDHYLQVHGSYCYTFVPHDREYPAAEAECHSRGGHLLVIRDADTQNFIYNEFTTTYHFNGIVWLGLSDAQREGVHVWVDGSPLTYTNWAPGEPTGAAYDCSGMDLAHHGQWEDYKCEDSPGFLGLGGTQHRNTFVCENLITGATTTPAQSASGLLAGCPSSLPANSHLFIHGSNCYDFVSSHGLEFNDAERECEQRNGHLVTIPDAGTQQFLYNTFTQSLHYHGEVWIGMTDQEREGQHHWVDGSPVTYTNWAPGEPTGAAYDCAIMDLSKHGEWVDYNCLDRHTFLTNEPGHHYFVCQYALPARTTPTTTHTTNTTTHTTTTSTTTESSSTTAVSISTTTSAGPTCPVITQGNSQVHVHGDSCYEFVSTRSLEFNSAEQECSVHGGHLVTIHDAGTQSFVYNTFRQDFPDFQGVIWIGMTDQQYEGIHTWTDGSPITFTNWAAGQPSGADSLDCVIMNIGQVGEWYDYACDNTFPTLHDHEFLFVCEYPILGRSTTERTTPAPTTLLTEPTIPEILSECFQCGDLDGMVPCTEEEMNETEPSTCPSGKHYCMIDIYKESQDSPVKYYKRCVNDTVCNLEFYFQYQQSDYCLHLDQDMPDILACHLCCHGDHCNNGTMPSIDALYNPQTTTVQSLSSSAAATTTMPEEVVETTVETGSVTTTTMMMSMSETTTVV